MRCKSERLVAEKFVQEIQLILSWNIDICDQYSMDNVDWVDRYFVIVGSVRKYRRLESYDIH